MARSAEGARRKIAERAGAFPLDLALRRDSGTGGAGPRSARGFATGTAKPGRSNSSVELAEWRSAAAHCAAQAGNKPSERCFSGAKRA